MIGTFGAIIRVKGPIRDRRALFDIGVAGPLAGFVAAIVALALGLLTSRVQDMEGQYGIHYGEPLIFKLMTFLIFGPLPVHTEIVLGPVAFAAWFGIFVTSLNLIPIGQLDGGHVAYALWGSRQQTIVFAVLVFVIVLGFVGWAGWLLWAFVAMILGFSHPHVVNPDVPLGRYRMLVSWIALAVFLLSFTPVPFSL
jgi:membrane-associated protease RseP (regulator of RpoE activity)